MSFRLRLGEREYSIDDVADLIRMAGMNGRFSTRPMVGRKSIGVELIFKLFLAFWLLY